MHSCHVDHCQHDDGTLSSLSAAAARRARDCWERIGKAPFMPPAPAVQCPLSSRAWISIRMLCVSSSPLHSAARMAACADRDERSSYILQQGGRLEHGNDHDGNMCFNACHPHSMGLVSVRWPKEAYIMSIGADQATPFCTVRVPCYNISVGA